MNRMRKSKIKKPTFCSYIGDEEIRNSISSIERIHEPDNNEDILLPGEVQVNKATLVHEVLIYNDCHTGVVGSLICTNFRVIFETLLQNGENTSHESQHYKLSRDYDLVLCNISTIYQVHKGRRKKLTLSSSSLSHVKHIEIRCKNLITRSFNLKTTPKHQVKSFLSALLHHTSPTRLELLFCFDYITTRCDLYRPRRSEDKETSHERDYPLTDFNRRSEWEIELQRSDASGYKTVECNNHFRISSTLPECFVIPSSLSCADIENAAGQYTGNRVPIWCYSHKCSGSSLLRMSRVIDRPGNINLVVKYEDAICSSGGEGCTASSIDLDSQIPYSLHDVRKSYKSLKSICMPATIKDLKHTDLHWYTKLDETNWLRIVSSCLRIVKEIVNKMSDLGTSIIVVETTGSDFTPIITCLVQLLMDPSLRSSRLRFQRLIDREWTAMGHRFSDRLGLISKPNDNISKQQSPMFILFLDCTSQLLQQFPCKFNISENFLVTMCDLVCSGLYSQFIFNNEKQRRTILEANQNANIMSSWQWSETLNDCSDIALFGNPLFDALIDGRLKKDGKQFIFEEKKPPKPPRKIQRQQYITSLGAEYIPNYPNIYRVDQVLKVEYSLTVLKFWSYYFLRWLSPMEIYYGGGASEYECRSSLADEISALRKDIVCLEDQLTNDHRNSKASGNTRTKAKWSRAMSSSFPFSSFSLLEHQRSVTCLTNESESSRISSLYRCSRTNSEDSIANVLDSSTRNSYDNSIDQLTTPTRQSPVFKEATPTYQSPVFKETTPTKRSPVFKEATQITPTFKEVNPPVIYNPQPSVSTVHPMYKEAAPTRIPPMYKPSRTAPIFTNANIHENSQNSKKISPELNQTNIYSENPSEKDIRDGKNVIYIDNDSILQTQDSSKNVESLFNQLGWK